MELLVAITVLSVALLALAGSMVPLMRLQTTDESRIEMTNLANDKLVEVQAAALSAVAPTLGGSLTSATAGFSESVLGLSGRSYLRRWMIEAGPLSTTYRVTVRVLQVGSDLQVDLSTLVVV